MASIQFTDHDRDDQGFIKAPAEPRSLRDLLPRSADSTQDAQRQRLTFPELAGLVAFACLALAIIAYAWSVPTMPGAPTRAAPTVRATIQPTMQPTSAPASPMRLLAAFASPDGLTLGTIEATRAYTVTAHYGDAWIQAQVAGSGLIWLRAIDLPGVAIVGPDLALPTPAPVAQPGAAPVIAPAACSADTAPYRVERRVLLGTLPIGAAMGFSCSSAAEAEANTSAHEAEVRQSYQATVTTKTSAATP